MADESGQDEQQPERPARKPAQASLEEREQRLRPRPSIWPVVLAISIAIALIGIILHPIILFCGLAFTLISIIGWILEKS